MTIFLPQYFEILKAAVIERSGFKSISPSDCRLISIKIYEATKQSISETTLKRVFGFAYSKFRPSLFTIDAMARFCGYDGWDEFCDKQEPHMKNANETNANWDTLKHSAAKITGFTLQTLKNKSGIPYNQTIPRKFINTHLDEFISNDYTATTLSAPADYGKTIALCHWIDKALEQNAAGKTNDIILFFSSSALMNVFLSGRDLNYWILGLLGYSKDEDILSIIDTAEKKGGNFYFIIDGLDEFTYKAEQFRLLLNQLSDLFALYKTTPWFKLILTVRSTTWTNNKPDLEDKCDKWFTGFIADENPALNVPLLSLQEIKELCLKINPALQSFMAPDIANNFNHPLFFQFYYKEHKNNFAPGAVDHIYLHELISNFVLNKVHLGHYSTEKLLLLNGLVDYMDFNKNLYDVDKLKVNNMIKQYSNAYNELISIGFLREVNVSTEMHYNTVVKFGNCNFLDFTIAKSLLLKNDYLFDAKLVNTINDQLAQSRRKLFVLKWCVIYAVRTGQQRSFDLLTRMQLTPNQKSELLIFMGELLDKANLPASRTENMMQYFNQDCSDEFFNYFFGLEFVSLDYRKTLHTLLKFDLCDNKKILIYMALACASVMYVDLPALKECRDKLKTFPPAALTMYAVNPVHCIDALYQFFFYGTIKRSFFKELTSFCFNPPKDPAGLIGPKPEDVIYLVAGYTLSIFRQPRKSLRYLNLLSKTFKTFNKPSPSYRFLLDIITADAHFMLGNRDLVIKFYHSALAIYNRDETFFTPFMKGLIYGLKIKISIIEKNYAGMVCDLKALYDVTNESGVKLSKLFLLVYILKSQGVDSVNPTFYKQVGYDFNKMIRECGINPEIFSNPEVIN